MKLGYGVEGCLEVREMDDFVLLYIDLKIKWVEVLDVFNNDYSNKQKGRKKRLFSDHKFTIKNQSFSIFKILIS